MAMRFLVAQRHLYPSQQSPNRFPYPHRRTNRFTTHTRSLPWDIPRLIFPRPENFFPRPERLISGDTIKELILKQGEAVKEFPWEYIIFLSITILVVVEIVMKPFDNTNTVRMSDDSDSSEGKTQRQQKPKESERRPVTMTEEQRTIYNMKKIQFQADQNKNLLLLGCASALALWLAGFLNSPHPFFP